MVDVGSTEIKRAEFFPLGRMISGTKTSPKGHICVFNANICIKSEGKIWFGDLDLTADVARPVAFAKAQGETLYVLREMDARFAHEANPLFDEAVATITPDGLIEYRESFI